MTTPSPLLTSPDPLTLPSSPLAARSTRSTRQQSSTKPRAQRPYSSPSKSFVLETGFGAAGEASPWRLKVTVEAEPSGGSGSPSAKRGQRQRVRERSVKLISMGDESESTDAMQPDQPLRKRKATSVRDAAKRTTTKTRERARDSATPDDADRMPPPPSPSTSSASRAKRRSSLKAFEISRPTQRSKRLSRAREELGVALREAVGGEGEYLDGGVDEDVDAAGDGEDDSEERYHDHEGGYGEGDDNVVGDMTVAGDEDFTMVSVETLQSMRGGHSLVSHRGEGDVSAASVSYWPSSPPQQDVEEVERVRAGVQYPDLPNETGQAKQGADYDAMSWRATILPRQPTSHKQSGDQRLDSEPSEWRRARELVSRRIQEANTSQVIVIDDDTVADAAGAENEDRVESDHAVDAMDADDIWQEEASRSVEEESEIEVRMAGNVIQRPSRRTMRGSAAPTARVTLTTGRITTTIIAAPSLTHDPLADQLIRPRRSKIPRTWRRSSGVDFAYSDSPAHVEPPPPLDVRKRDASTDGGGSRASSGVLTPPSSGDEDGQRTQQQEEGQGQNEDMSDADFTRPDAEATMLQQDKNSRSDRANENETAASLSDGSASSVTSADGEESGMFWQSNVPAAHHRQPERPRLPRPGQQKRAMDLTELLGLDGSSSPVKPRLNTATRDLRANAQVPIVPLQTRPTDGAIHHSERSADSGANVVSSPLRRSLLRSSRVVGDSPSGQGAGRGKSAHGEGGSSQKVSGEVAVEEDTMADVSVQGEDVVESFASKASHQRQLLTEMVGATRFSCLEAQMEVEVGAERNASGEYTQDVVDDEYVREEEEEEYLTEEPSRSYEEHLNVESPQKIKVKFGDSLDSSLLVPKRAYAPLFGSTRATQQQRVSATLSTTKQTSTTTTSTTTASLSQHRDSLSQTILSLLSTTFWSALTRPTPFLPPPAPYPQALRANLRSRYGVLTTQHPWTMAHMRTLHRMHNSCSSGKIDTIIPRPGTASPELPAYLLALVGRELTSTSGSHDWLFTAENAQVVLAFLQVLVPASTILAMENGEVEVLGDETAAEHRTTLAGRRAEDMVWGDEIGVWGKREVIEWGFVVGALGDCLGANIRTAAREAAKEAAREGVRT
ncbi:hypothetical protein B0A54_13562 [Friedmanniomyces endolithicus]|uniref:Uncharacterized protein n=1 Tax=Friedmanniomyces endolithicus TaxID=329885 RepID=A0A4U0ULJ1_9PEZI|nr:hypothetical protein LTS09_017523 [Friedmanniomyces endolithicus]TKA36560.1 hypothetical protein B0A54_13562 [Friedmanniomyces endolithicus]